MSFSDAFQNTTANSTADGLGPVFGLLVALFGLFLLAAFTLNLARSLERFKQTLRIIRALRTAGENFLIGALGLIPIALVVVPAYFFGTASSETQGNIAAWGGGAILAFAALATYGHFIKKWKTRVQGFKAAAEVDHGKTPALGTVDG